MVAMHRWRELLQHERLIEAAAACPDLADPAAIARLRKKADADLVRTAIDLVIARRKAVGKLAHADQLLADTQAVEQATSHTVARHKAARFAQVAPHRIVDLCCGVGGDAMALAAVAPVWLVDHAPGRAWCARHNVRLVTGCDAPAAATEVADLDLHDQVFHIDPSRRDARGRLHHWADYQPGPDTIAPLLERNPTGAIKLGPGVDADVLPEGEVEFISEAGTLVQAVLWTGDLAAHERTATVLTPGQSEAPHRVLHGAPAFPPITTAARYLFAIDPAVERSGLLGNLCDEQRAAMIHPALGLMTSDRRLDDPFLTPFELIEQMPWRRRKVRDWLSEHDGGIVEVKTRDKAVDPDRAQADLRGNGSTIYTLFILRFEQEVRTLITRRLSARRSRPGHARTSPPG